jgi:hypothetical protein
MPKRLGPSETGGLPHGVEEPVWFATEQSVLATLPGVVEQSTTRTVSFCVGRRWLRKRLSAFCVVRAQAETLLRPLGASRSGGERERPGKRSLPALTSEATC